jgi:hypothetical protein
MALRNTTNGEAAAAPGLGGFELSTLPKPGR